VITELVTGPANEPLSYQQVCDHLRIQTVDEDMDASSIEYIDRLIVATRTHLEHSYLNRALVTQTWKVYYDEFPSENYIKIPFPPLQTVTHIKYTDSDGTPTTMTLTTDYLVDAKSTPGRLVLPYNESWPSVTLHPRYPIEIQYICGYGDDPEDVPDAIRHAMLLMIADMYENREDLVERAMSNNRTLDRLLFNYRVWKF